MRLSSSSLVVANVALLTKLDCSQAWSSSAALSSRTLLSGQSNARRGYNNFQARNFASVKDDIVTSSSFSETEGESIAKGNIVSYFAGGLTAVKLESDTVSTTKTTTTKVKKDNEKKKETGDDFVGRLVKLPNNDNDDSHYGVVIAQRPPIAFVYSARDSDVEDNSNGAVEIMDTMAKISVGDNMSIVNAFGQPSVEVEWGSRAIFSPIPKVSDISLINEPMLTGTTMVDVLAPIGKGQNMLLIGSDLSQMRDITSNFVKAQSEVVTTQCIYAITSQDDRDAIIKNLEQDGLLESTIIVAVRKDDDESSSSETSKAAEAITVASTACAIAESFAKDKGQDAVVIIDNIDYHKKLWDETTRTLVDIWGIDAVVAADREGGASSEMRAFYSALIQRAANYKGDNGGSVTLALMTTIPSLQQDNEDEELFQIEDFSLAGDRIKDRLDMLVQKNIPLTASTLRKIKIPIPSAKEGKRRLVLQHVDDLISMSDGQIWLDDEKFSRMFPPVDPQRSITRIGIGADTESRADAPAIRRIVEGIRLELQQAANMDGAELTTFASKKQMQRGKAWYLAMDQEPGTCRSLAETCITLLAASMGALDDIIGNDTVAGSKEGRTIIKELMDHAQSVAPNATKEVNTSLDLTPDTRKELEEAINSYFTK